MRKRTTHHLSTFTNSVSFSSSQDAQPYFESLGTPLEGQGWDTRVDREKECISVSGSRLVPAPSQAEGMISEIRSAFEEALGQLVWMDEKTRRAAKEKVSRSKGWGAIFRWGWRTQFFGGRLGRETLT